MLTICVCCLDTKSIIEQLRQSLCDIYKESGEKLDSWIVNTARIYMKSENGPFIFKPLILDSTESIQAIFSTDLTTSVATHQLKHLLIEGVSKIGKTFLVKKIAQCWADGKVLKDSKLLFFVYLGDPKLKEVQSGDKLIEYCISTTVSPKVKTAIMKFILDDHGKNVAFVFDAVNEYPVVLSKKNFITQVIKNKSDIFRDSTIIITSHPKDTNLLRDVVDRGIELLGVSYKEQKNASSPDNLPIKAKLKDYYWYHPVIRGLSYIPCHLEALVELLHLRCLPDTLVDMNVLFISHKLNKYLIDEGKKMENFPETFTVFRKLKNSSETKKLNYFPETFTALAFKGLEGRRSVFTLDEIRQAYPELDEPLESVLLQDYMRGRVFFKLRIQDYLAALYVSTLSEEDQLKCIEDKFEQKCFRFMWLMYATMQPDYFNKFCKRNGKKCNQKLWFYKFQCHLQTREKMCEVDHIFSSCGIEMKECWKSESIKLNCFGMNSLLRYVVINEISLKKVDFHFSENIKKFDFSENVLSPWGVYCAVIKYCKNNNLTLCGDEGMKDYVTEIEDSLKKHENLKSLILLNIGSIGLESIKEVLHKSSTLKRVSLSWKQVEDAKENILVHRKFVHHGHTVDINVLYDGGCVDGYTINLSNKGINDDGVCLIAFGLGNNKIVKNLDLSHNKITDVGAKAIVDCLKNNSKLQQLNLSWNNIANIKDTDINSSLHNLDASHNCISDCDTSLPNNYRELKEINLSENKIQLFGWNLGEASKLGYVDLSGNISSPWNVYYAIIKNCCVSSLTLCGCHGMNKYAKEIMEILQTCQKLKSLMLCHTEKIAYGKSDENKIYRRITRIKVKGKLNSTTAVDVSYNCDFKHSHNNDEHVDISNQNLNDDTVFLITCGLYNNTTVKKLDLSCNNITDDGALAISNCLKSRAMLREVNLSNNNINEEGAEAIAKALEGNDSLEKLDMMGNNICDVGAKAFGSCLKINCTLCEINLSGNAIQNRGAQGIAQALIKDNSTLQKLDISDNLLTDDGVIFISDCLKSNAGLMDLNLLGNEITIKGLQKIAEVKAVLKKLCVSVVDISGDVPFSNISNSTLHTLDLSRNCIDPKCAGVICNIVKQSTALCELNFTQSSIGLHNLSVKVISECLISIPIQILKIPGSYIDNEGMEIIIASIKNGAILQKLDFSDNEIGDDGVKALSDYLQSKSCKLQTLNLSCNKFTSTGASFIANALKLNVTLQELDISNNDISDVGIEVVSNCLKSITQQRNQFQNTRGLKKLYISHIKISDCGLRSVKDFLKNNCTLCFLDLSNNDITSNSVNIIAEALRYNNTLKILDISSNNLYDDGITSISNHLNNTLQELNLSSNHITDIGIENLAKAIKCNQRVQLRILDISNNKIIKHEEIIDCLKANTALQEVIL